MYEFHPMTESAAVEIAGWQYEPPYDLYNLDSSDATADLALMVDPTNAYYAITDGSSDLIGFCCFGKEGQVPGGDYDLPALDVGVGMRPDLIGQGRGQGFLASVLAFARQEFDADCFRATVASFNERSLRMCLTAGFRETQRFTSRTATPREFVVLLRLA